MPPIHYTKRPAACAIAACLALPASPAFAQVVVDRVSGSFQIEAPQFFFAIVAGILMALALQMVLTMLSVSLGLSFVPSLRPKIRDAKEHARAHERQERELKPDEKRSVGAAASPTATVYPDETMGTTGNPYAFGDKDDHHETGETLVTAINGFGLWALVTTSVALFFSSWMAVELSLVTVLSFGVILGLVIWATFLAIISYMEAKGVRSLMGGMFSLASSAFSSSFTVVRGILSKSEEKKMEDAGRNMVHAIYEEVSDLAHHDKIDRRLAAFLRELAPEEPDYDRIRADVIDLLEHVRVEEKVEVEEDELVKVLTAHFDRHHHKGHRHGHKARHASKLTQTVREAIEETRKHRGEGRAEQAAAAAEKLAPMSDEDARALRERLGEILARSGKEELQPDQLRGDLERILHDPKAGPGILRQRLDLLDRDTVASLVAANTKLSKLKAEKLVDRVIEATGMIQEKAGQAGDRASGTQETFGGKARDTRSRITSLPGKASDKFAAYLADLDREELDPEVLRADLEAIMADPKRSPEIIRQRLGRMDRHTVETVLASNPRISDEQAQDIVDRVFEARDEAVRRINLLEEETLRRYQVARQHTFEAAENVRITAISASWWLFTAAVASGGAAALGGWVAVAT